MLGFLADLLRGESQRNPHHHAATFGTHCWLALGLWGVLAMAIDMWTAAWMTPLIYLVAWEGLQFALAPAYKRTVKLAFDCLLDAVGVAFGAYAAALLGKGYQVESIWCWAASLIVMAVGWRVRT